METALYSLGSTEEVTLTEALLSLRRTVKGSLLGAAVLRAAAPLGSGSISVSYRQVSAQLYFYLCGERLHSCQLPGSESLLGCFLRFVFGFGV